MYNKKFKESCESGYELFPLLSSFGLNEPNQPDPSTS